MINCIRKSLRFSRNSKTIRSKSSKFNAFARHVCLCVWLSMPAFAICARSTQTLKLFSVCWASKSLYLHNIEFYTEHRAIYVAKKTMEEEEEVNTFFVGIRLRFESKAVRFSIELLVTHALFEPFFYWMRTNKNSDQLLFVEHMLCTRTTSTMYMYTRMSTSFPMRQLCRRMIQISTVRRHTNSGRHWVHEETGVRRSIFLLFSTENQLRTSDLTMSEKVFFLLYLSLSLSLHECTDTKLNDTRIHSLSLLLWKSLFRALCKFLTQRLSLFLSLSVLCLVPMNQRSLYSLVRSLPDLLCSVSHSVYIFSLVLPSLFIVHIYTLNS